MIETIIVRAVRLGVVGGREDRHLVTVDGVVTEKELHLVGNLFGCACVFPATNLRIYTYFDFLNYIGKVFCHFLDVEI